MNAETLSAIAGAILSLGMSYIPGIAPYYNAQSPTVKRAVMAVLLIIATALSLGAGCIGAFEAIASTCDQNGAETALRALLLALMANQATYMLSPASSETAAPA